MRSPGVSGRGRRAWAALWLAALSGGAAAADAAPKDAGLPLWEAGIAGGTGLVPDYPGADRRSTRGIVLPYLVYRGPILRVEGGAIRGRLFESPHWSVELTATGAFNARSNEARQGMPDLDYLFGVGPQLVYKGLQTGGRGPTVHLKLRALMSTDFHRIDSRGYSFDPELRWRIDRVAGTPASLTLSLQPTWASGALHRYFYAVEPAQATASRPAFAARAGFLGTDFGATLRHSPAPGLSWFVTGIATSMHGAANTASPLLRERVNLSVGAGLIWTPWRSTARVRD